MIAALAPPNPDAVLRQIDSSLSMVCVVMASGFESPDFVKPMVGNTLFDLMDSIVSAHSINPDAPKV